MTTTVMHIKSLPAVAIMKKLTKRANRVSKVLTSMVYTKMVIPIKNRIRNGRAGEKKFAGSRRSRMTPTTPIKPEKMMIFRKNGR
jgi:predicted CoA-binding protein